MTVENTQSEVSYVTDGVLVAFPTTYKFLNNGDLLVQLSTDGGVTWITQVLGGDYDVAGAGADEPGGTVTFLVAPAAGTLQIIRNTPITQELALQTSGPLPAKSLTLELDKLTLIAQEARRDIAALQAGSVGSTYTVVRVTDTFTVNDPLESNFPRSVAVGAAPKGAVIGRIENLGTPTEVLDQPPSLQWNASGNNLSVTRIDGLTVGQQYRITYEVFTV